jgi:hypothetical protein
LEGRGQPEVHSEFKTSLGYIDNILSQNKHKQRTLVYIVHKALPSLCMHRLSIKLLTVLETLQIGSLSMVMDDFR